jgi:uncharacterized protein with HEPN domain
VAHIGQERFLAGGVEQDAIIRQLTVAGETASKLSTEFQQNNPQIPWQKIIGFRNRVIHDYFGLDLDAVWKIATEELPVLRAQVIALMAEEFSPEPERPED